MQQLLNNGPLDRRNSHKDFSCSVIIISNQIQQSIFMISAHLYNEITVFILKLFHAITKLKFRCVYTFLVGHTVYGSIVKKVH